MKKLYVGNLPWSTTADELGELFGQCGEVRSINLVTDRETGQSRGFAFVEMNDSGADRAISQMNGKAIGDRNLKVNIAVDRNTRTGGGSGGARRRY
jgi:RNA recognition motif-containing protein